MKEMTDLEKYYNKFNEDKRLTRRHGQVEFITSMKYIHECIGDRKCVKILDIGAGTGRYSVALANDCLLYTSSLYLPGFLTCEN